MSSHDSEGESYVVDYLADPKVYGDLEHCGWTTEEEEDYDPKGKEETSLDEDEVPLPKPGDMHMEFRKSSLPNTAKKPKIEFIPFRLLQENKQELCKKILSLEQEINDLRDQNYVLKRKLRKKPTPSTKPSPSSLPKKTEHRVWALPLATAKLGGVPQYRITITFIFTVFLSSILLVISDTSPMYL